MVAVLGALSAFLLPSSTPRGASAAILAQAAPDTVQCPILIFGWQEDCTQINQPQDSLQISLTQAYLTGLDFQGSFCQDLGEATNDWLSDLYNNNTYGSGVFGGPLWGTETVTDPGAMSELGVSGANRCWVRGDVIRGGLTGAMQEAALHEGGHIACATSDFASGMCSASSDEDEIDAAVESCLNAN